jgi:hypothetical protein
MLFEYEILKLTLGYQNCIFLKENIEENNMHQEFMALYSLRQI